MKTFTAIFFWVLAGLGFGWFTCAERLHEWLVENNPELSPVDAIARALRSRPEDFDDPEAARLASWMWRFGIGFLIGFLLWISMAFWPSRP